MCVCRERKQQNRSSEQSNTEPRAKRAERAYHVVLLAVHLAVHIVEGLAAQRSAARAADEAVGVVQVAHRLARLTGAGHLLAARVAYAKVFALLFAALQFLLQLARQLLDFALRFGGAGRPWRRHVVRQQRFRHQLVCGACEMWFVFKSDNTWVDKFVLWRLYDGISDGYFAFSVISTIKSVNIPLWTSK